MAFSKPQRDVERVFIHCSASDVAEHDSIEVIRRWHVDPPPQGRGWSDVGYHFFIRKDGELEDGRDLERIPAAQGGNNTGTIAICLHGLDEDRFTPAQFETLLSLCKEIDTAYQSQVTFHGHREVANKDCPVFDYARVLGLDSDGSFARPAVVERARAGEGQSLPVLKTTARGEAVEVLQTSLNRHGANIDEDGVFGQGTRSAVVAFQAGRDLVADGIVGPATWLALARL